MATVQRFEELIAWKKARELTWEIYLTTRRGTFARDFGLSNQLQRAAVSIMSNLAEGFERGKRTEFHQYACIAKGSCGELRSQLFVALDAAHISQPEFDHLFQRAEELSRIIGGLRSALAKQRDRR